MSLSAQESSEANNIFKGHATQTYGGNYTDEMHSIYYQVLRDAEGYTLTFSRRPLDCTANPVTKRVSFLEMMNAVLEFHSHADSRRFGFLSQSENDLLGEPRPTIFYDSD